ncbi:MAG TPA: glutaredoxin family protein [Symbiobacteriaceae bacterium]
MNFPMIGGMPDGMNVSSDLNNPTAGESAMTPSLTNANPQAMGQAAAQPAMPAAQATASVAQPAAEPVAPAPGQAAPAQPGQATGPQVIVYGRAGCQACLEAIQDLIDRQASFTYIDVGRDPAALNYVQALCGGVAMVPVIVQIGFSGGY